jgi:hypothetical protein
MERELWKPEEIQGGRVAVSLKRNREGELREAWRDTGRELWEA